MNVALERRLYNWMQGSVVAGGVVVVVVVVGNVLLLMYAESGRMIGPVETGAEVWMEKAAESRKPFQFSAVPSPYLAREHIHKDSHPGRRYPPGALSGKREEKSSGKSYQLNKQICCPPFQKHYRLSFKTNPPYLEPLFFILLALTTQIVSYSICPQSTPVVFFFLDYNISLINTFVQLKSSLLFKVTIKQSTENKYFNERFSSNLTYVLPIFLTLPRNNFIPSCIKTNTNQPPKNTTLRISQLPTLLVI